MVKVKAITEQKKESLEVAIYFNTDQEFVMGDSSFVFSNERGSLIKPTIVMFNADYSDNKCYNKMKAVTSNPVVSMVQLFLNTERCGIKPPIGKDVLLCVVHFDIAASPFNLKWRVRDSAIVTPDYQTIPSEFSIEQYVPKKTYIVELHRSLDNGEYYVSFNHKNGNNLFKETYKNAADAKEILNNFLFGVKANDFEIVDCIKNDSRKIKKL